MSRTVLALGLALFLSGCDDGPTAPSDVIGETWSLVSLQETGSTPVVVTDASLYRVTFGDDGRLTVSSGDASLDTKFTNILQQAETISVDDGELTIQSAAGILKFDD